MRTQLLCIQTQTHGLTEPATDRKWFLVQKAITRTWKGIMHAAALTQTNHLTSDNCHKAHTFPMSCLVSQYLFSRSVPSHLHVSILRTLLACKKRHASVHKHLNDEPFKQLISTADLSFIPPTTFNTNFIWKGYQQYRSSLWKTNVPTPV